MKAFPSKNAPYYIGYEGASLHQAGMDLRDYFAAKAMQADISNYTNSHQFGKDFWTTENVAKRAYNMADAMMKAREE